MSDGQKTATNDRSVSVTIDLYGSAAVSVVTVIFRSLLLSAYFLFPPQFDVDLGSTYDATIRDACALYRQRDLPIEKRVAHLLGRMTLEEKARQLDLYSGTTALLNRHTDSTHAAPRALFLPDKAQTLWGNLGVGGIHDLNPTAGTGECHPEVGHRA